MKGRTLSGPFLVTTATNPAVHWGSLPRAEGKKIAFPVSTDPSRENPHQSSLVGRLDDNETLTEEHRKLKIHEKEWIQRVYLPGTFFHAVCLKYLQEIVDVVVTLTFRSWLHPI
jgi:hypothetical protein